MFAQGLIGFILFILFVWAGWKFFGKDWVEKLNTAFVEEGAYHEQAEVDELIVKLAQLKELKAQYEKLNQNFEATQQIANLNRQIELLEKKIKVIDIGE
ncbi:hypothetical protein KAR91_13120 [Candidatus Pacearchaeota archaeon]|nr:hypothetical protein [Candidatus Pacearchaeota archaeon]